MAQPIIKIENLSKQYRLGLVGSGTLRGDMTRWWYRIRGKEDPTLKIGQENQLDNASGEYIWALKDINFEVKQGEILGIIGKNGAGKSTLLKILSRVTGPTTGSVKVKGRIASLLEVGTGFHPELTGRDNIFLNGAILGMNKTEIRKKFDEIVDFAGVARYIDTPVKRYSSGMYVRLAFAVAAHLEPDILIVDEVLAVGDAEFQKKAIGKMQDISSSGGRTILFVSHNMSSIRQLCTKSIILNNGKILFSGTTNDSIKKYLSKERILSQIDISKRSDRKGSGEIKIYKVELFDLKGNCINKITVGQTFEIVLYYKIHENIDFIKTLDVSIGAFNEEGIRLFNHTSKLNRKTFSNEELKKSEQIKFRIYQFPFPKGSYSMFYNLIQGDQYIDGLSDAYILNVENGQIFHNNINPHPAHGITIINAECFIK